MTEETDIPDGDDLLAAEYALGLLGGEERARFEARLAVEGELRALVAFWEDQLAGLTDAIPAAAPPPAVWRRIEAALPPPLPATRSSSASPWRILAGLATAAVLALAALMFLAPPEAPDAALFAGEVRAEDASQRFVVAYDAQTGALRVARAAGGASPGRSLELWAIHEGRDPVSLAVLPAEAEFQMVLPENMRPDFTAATLAITDEPEGGAPGGQPTGPVVAVGGITRL